MDGDKSFAVRLAQLATLILLATAALGSLGIGLAFSAGAWTKEPAVADIQNVVRVMAGVFGAFAVTAAAEMVLKRRTDKAVVDGLSLLERQVKSMQTLLHPGIDAVLKNRDDLQPWRRSVADCKHLQMSGLSLRTFTNENLGSIREMLEAGGDCQFLLVEPGSKSSAVTAKNFLGQESPDAYDREIRASIDRLMRLKAAFPAYIEIRTLDHIPAASITILETRHGKTSIYVEFYTEEESSIGRPHLELHANDAPQWFSYFKNQFDVLWKRAVQYVEEV